MSDNKEAAAETEYIKLKVVGQDSNEIHFRVKFFNKYGQAEKILCWKSWSACVIIEVCSFLVELT